MEPARLLAIPDTSVIQIAAFAGVYGVSFVIVVVNAALAGFLRIQGGWTTALPALGTAVVIITVALAPRWMTPVRDTTPPISVAVVQGSIDQGVKWDPAYRDATLNRFHELSESAARARPQMIVWPETAVPVARRDDPAWKVIEARAPRYEAHLIVGALDWQGARPTNSAFLLAPDGRAIGRYDKRHLVPFGEYVPLERALFFVNVVAGGTIGALTPGGEATLLTLPFGPVGVVICYEAIFPRDVRSLFVRGAELLVNITNDAWFGRSAAPVQHLAMAVFRAVENRTYLVRAANSGISAIVAPDGRIVRRGGLFTPEVIQGHVSRRGAPSFYTRYGDVFAWAAAGLGLALLLRRRTPSSIDASVRNVVPGAGT